MDSNQSLFSTDGEISQELRRPLASIMPSSTNIPTNQLRHKTSIIVRVDSSEDIPSPHPSIFEALYTSPQNSDEGANGIELTAVGTNVTQILDENSRAQGKPEVIAMDTGEFLYGRGTVLDTITEQKSYGTLHAFAKENPTENMPNFPFVRHRDSFMLGQTPRRKQAFSLDDIALTQSSYHEACALIERETHRQLPIHEIYAEPRNPIHAPLERPATPEGMPSWASSQNIPRPSQPTQQPRSRGRFRRLIGLSAQPVAQSANARSVSDPIRGRQAPRFRPPRSVYGLIDQHPFNNAPVARVVQAPVLTRKSTLKGKNKAKSKTRLQVRFTPSATARDSEITALRTAIESTSASAPHPIMPFNPPISPIATIKCTHTKGRIALARATHNLNIRTTDPPSNEYVIDPSSPNPDQSMGTPYPSRAVSPSRPVSVTSITRSEESGFNARGAAHPLYISSTTHLMSGALIPSQTNIPPQSEFLALTTKLAPKSKELWCWKCKVQAAAKKADHWRIQSASCLCFIFCGYDIQDDASCVSYSAADGSKIVR